MSALELVAFFLLAVLPVWPYLAFALRTGVERFSIAGDFALLEQATRHVWHGDALLGPYSRFRWHHPGPLFFYIAAPFEALFGPKSTGLFVGACVVNAAAAAALVANVRMSTTRAHAAASLLVVLAWFAAFGNVTASPWNPLVIVLPLVTFLVSCALFARGETRAFVPAAFFGALALSTHVAAITTVVVAATVAVLIFVARRHVLTRRDRGFLACGLAIVVLAFLPPLVEQVTAPRGNLRALATFFLHRAAPPKPLSVALKNAIVATSWMPDRLFSHALPEEGWVPLGMRWDNMPERVSRTAATIALVHVTLVVLAFVVARLRRDATSLAILGFGVLAEVVALVSLRSIVGADMQYLVFWTTAASSVAWLGTLSALISAASAASLAVLSPRGRKAATCGLACAGLLLAATATSFQAQWLAKHSSLPGSYRSMNPLMSRLHAALRERMAREGATPVIHLEGAYDLAEAMVLELEKDGLDVRVLDADRWLFTGVSSEANIVRPLHVWFSQPALPLAKAPCLELLEEREGHAIYVAAPHCHCCP
ncbi:MAG TPA: glycosyltransferase family 39 protein [Labilithrix sp.]|nr:glycosyltransferase family 39 protein [Labilithrix sp.]